MGECPICICVYTKELRQKITCDFCAYEACRECVKTYVLSTPESPHCMNCHKSWGRVFLSKKFTQSFMNNHFKHARENILFDREKSMFQATQPYIEIKMREYEINKELNKNYNQIHDLKYRLSRFFPIDLETKRIEIDLRHDLSHFQLDNECLQFEKMMIQNGQILVDKDKAREFIKKCPRSDCNGFLSSKWKCAVCKLYSCKECHEALDEGHTCDPNTVETVKHLATNDYRNCPKCSANIFKIEGCSQMYCTYCKTAFDWKTGKIVTGRIHNPHYYEYMRNRGTAEREIGDIQCGGLPGVRDIAYHVGWNSPLVAFHRILLEFQDHNIEPDQEIDQFQLNLNERVKFLCKNISERDFKTHVQQKDKAIQKKREIMMINTTFIQIMTDIYNRITKFNEKQIIQEVKEACEYTNGLWVDIGKAYSCVVPRAEFDKMSIKNQKVQ